MGFQENWARFIDSLILDSSTECVKNVDIHLAFTIGEESFQASGFASISFIRHENPSYLQPRGIDLSNVLVTHLNDNKPIEHSLKIKAILNGAAVAGLYDNN